MLIVYLKDVYIHSDEQCCSSQRCVRVTCKAHKSVRRDGNYMREPCHPFYRGDIYLQETILSGFHRCQETFGRDEQNTGPNSVATPFGTLGWSSSGPKTLEGFKSLRSLVTPSFETTMSSMRRVNLLRNGASLWSFLLNTSINWSSKAGQLMYWTKRWTSISEKHEYELNLFDNFGTKISENI